MQSSQHRSTARTARLALVACVMLAGSCTRSEPQPGVFVAAIGGVDGRCREGMNIIEGTAADDVLVGTAGDDCIVGLEGDDRIDGLGGDDVLIGSDGNDELHGGDGADTFYGADGNDRMFGDAGDDTLSGHAGDDHIEGGDGADSLGGFEGADELVGGAGSDWIAGGDGCDRIDARDGDSAVGEGGNDVIDGRGGWGWLVGGAGDDLILTDPGVTAEGGDGIDACEGTGCELASPSSCAGGSACGAGAVCVPVALVCAPATYCGGGTGCGGGMDGGVLDGGAADCDDGNACTDDTCSAGSCVHAPRADGSACSDGDVCDGDETCVAASCTAGTPLVIDDGNACTIDACDPVSGVSHAPVEPDAIPDDSCNGTDDDCDGNIDEDYVATSTTCGVGACAATGTTSCASGTVVDSCTAGTPAADDASCNGVDDDCSGSTDEDYASVATSCGVGACSATGITSCVAGSVVDSCAPGAGGATDATCDGVDDDCSGMADEDYVSAATSCGVGACGATGATSCVSGAVVNSCVPGTAAASDATCDGIDDDCSGIADEDYTSAATSCGVGACGATGATSCVAGMVVDSCSPGLPAGDDATCDGVDDDCSGVADEDFVGASTSCGVGACGAVGATSCVAGAVVDSCAPGTPAASDSTCDGVDDDCSGVADEDFVGASTSCGVGACGAAGATSCVAGAVVDSCTPGTPAASDATCDGVDDDCSGVADEDYASVATSCGVGACGASGATSCVAGAVVDSCTPGAPASSDATCDGVDDDCSGAVDEDYASIATSCGVGACGASGVTSCVAGTVADSCVPGTPAASDSTCDGVDDDCSGAVDEDYASVATSCGVGACGATGATSCMAGAVVDSCVPGVPAPNDATCNAIDDDCSGAVDEDYASVATSCGIGACTAIGATSCAAGTVIDSCVPGPAASSDATCDGIDDDCSGTADEDYLGVITGCGVGACAAAGATSCVSGAVVDSCSPGVPAADDATCNGVDDDCSGVADEDFVSITTTCGIGACNASGALACIGGATLDTCVPGTPASSDATCDGIDDDCDAATDESFAPRCDGTAVISCLSGAEVAGQCSDGDACTGVESCASAACVFEDPPSVDDGNPCTADACDAIIGVTHTPLAVGSSCSDADPCNGAETCDASAACAAGTPPALDDGNPCTADACDPLHGVTHAALAEGVSCDDGDACNGIETCDGAGHCFPGFHPLDGPCIPAAPVAAIFVDQEREVSRAVLGASVVSYTGTTAPTHSVSGISWNPSVLASGPALVIDLVGAEPVALGRFDITPGGGANARHVELAVSRTGTADADFTVVTTMEISEGGPRWSHALDGVTARYVRLRVLDNWNGQSGRGNLSGVTLWTRPRDGGGISLFEGGVPVTATSNASTASRATDASATSSWRGATPIAGQSITVDLPGDDWHVVDRVRLRGTTSSTALIRDFEVWVSSSGTAASDFTRVLTGTLPAESTAADYYFFFAPTMARHVRLVALTNRGATAGVDVLDFQVFTAHEGGLTAPFQSRSIAGGTPIIAYRWDFGDGTFSASENPTHTFPAAGSYVVELEVQDEWGLTRSTTYAYEAHEPPLADFTYLPSAPRQGETLTLRDVSSASGPPLIRGEWSVITATDTLVSTPRAPGETFTVPTAPPGDVVATLTVTDATFVQASYTQTIAVTNVAPSADVGADQTLVWGEQWVPLDAPIVTDASSFDRPFLVCHWDFADGTTLDITRCEAARGSERSFYRQHSWSTPGTYDVSLTVTDTSGASGEDRFFVEVTRRPTVLGLDPVPGAGAGGAHVVTARLADGYDGSASMAGRTVTFSLREQSVSAVTNADGVATATLEFLGADDRVAARFAGDSLYVGAAHEQVYPEETRPDTRVSCGREFVIPLHRACMANTDGECIGEFYPLHQSALFLSGDVETIAEVSVPLASYRSQVRVPARGVGRTLIPFTAELPPTSTVSERAIRVRAARPVCAVLMTYERYSTDAMLALPVEGLGTEYVVATYSSFGNSGHFSQLAVAATADGTTVTVTPSVAMRAGGVVPSTTTPGVPFSFVLDAGDAVQLRGQGNTAAFDLTGTIITASAPIAVTAGNNCARVPVGIQACDYITEQLPPAETLGTDYLAAPLATRTGGYVLRVVAATNDTEVRVDGVVLATINRGQWREIDVPNQTARRITTSAPALVMQYAKSSQSDSRLGDPFQMLLVPTDQLGRDFGFSTIPDYFEPHLGRGWTFANYVTLVAPVATLGGVRLDGAPVTATFTPIGTSGWAYAHVQVLSGDHRVSHVSPGATVAAYVYGWAGFESYGYPGFTRLVPNEACTPQANVPGNGADDDCDGRLDEEDPNGLDDDGDGLIDEDTFLGELSAPNVAPVAYDGSVGTREDAPVSFVLAGFDPNGDALSFEVLSGPTNGVLSGTAPTLAYVPADDFSGVDTIDFRVCDAGACSAAATFTVRVASVNDAPDIEMAPIVNALEDAIFRLPCVSVDVDLEPGCALTWALVSGPPGMTIDAATGDIFWLPDDSISASSVTVTVRVTDCHGASSTFSFGIGVASVADRPIITSSPVRAARVGRAYSYDVNARDPDPGDTVTFAILSGAPAGMTIHATTGIVSWTPGIADGGRTYPIEVVAIDSTGLISHPQRFDIVVTGDTTAPTVSVTATPSTLVPGASSTVHVGITDDEPGAVLEAATLAGAPITLDGSGNYVFAAVAPGVFRVEASGHDASGNGSSGSAVIRVLHTDDDAPPAVALTAPAEDAVLTYLHEATGSVSDEHLYRWSLAMRRADRGAYRELASGGTNVSGALATLDTTQLENGIYVLRLRAEDVNGQVGEVTRSVRVDGGAKVGVVQLSFVDLVTDELGLPLAVVRSYDSRTADRSEEFGHGWSLELRRGSVMHNRPVGTSFAITTRPGSLPCTQVFEQASHYTEVRLSDSEWYVFRPAIVNQQQVGGGCTGEVIFELADGVTTGATLEPDSFGPVRATSLPVAVGIPTMRSDLTNLYTGELYNPQRFTLTLRDGREFVLSVQNGIERFRDANGNEVAITRGGLVHSDGRSMRFVRDARNRITQVIDTAGRSVGYEYDGAGNLAAFVDPLGRRTRYEYREGAYPHHLTDIVDWRGVRVAALDYQSDGRLRETCDADGRCLQNAYDLGARTMTTTDGGGIPTQYLYDARGNLTRSRDGLGHETVYQYHPTCPDRLVAAIDPLGHTRQTRYSLFDCDIVAQIEPADDDEPAETWATRFTHDDAGRVLTETQPAGGVVSHEYDDDGNELFVRDGEGTAIFARTFDDAGRMLTSTDRFGTTTHTYGSTSVGPTHVIDPRGAEYDLTYDAEGHVTSITRDAVTMRFRYDAAGRMTFADYGRGITVRFEYGDAGNEWTAIEGPTFGRAERTFSAAGRLIAWRMPSGDTGSRVYDAGGRLVQETDAHGNVTTHAYDAAGRLLSTTDVGRGATRTFERDAAGQVTAVIDPLTHRTEYVRDARGGLESLTDALSHEWTFEQSPTSSSSTQPTGEATVTQLSQYGLVTGTVQPGGATTSIATAGLTSLDESSRFPTSREDESGRTREYGYDALGALSSASDLGGADWAYDYDAFVAGDVVFDIESGRVGLGSSEQGDDTYRFTGGGGDGAVSMAMDAYRHALSSVTSPEGEVTRWHRDARGHVDLVEYPHGGVESRTYGTDGYEATRTLAHGTTLTYTRDAAGRVLEREGSDGSQLEWTYGAADRVATTTDSTGVTDFAYDAAGRWTGIDYPTTAEWSRAFDALDRVTHVRVRESATASLRDTEYRYDAAGRIEEIIDPLGGHTTFEHNASGRMTRRELPNGVVTTWTYDARGWVDTLTHRRADTSVIASLDYDRSPSGEPTRITREDGSYVEYDYDAALRLTEEHYFAAGGAPEETITYAYDDDGNRTSRTTSAGTETYTYGPGSELLSISGATTASYVYDDAGRATAITRAGTTRTLDYDADDHVVRVAQGTSEVRFQFDAQGRRVRAERLSGGLSEHVSRYAIAPTGVEDLESPHLVTDDAGGAQLGYVFAGEHPLLRYDPVTGEAVYYLQDAMGSVVGLADEDATATSTFHYDGFGNERRATGALTTLPIAAGGDFRFQGMWQDRDTGLYYVRARTYEAETGRFTSRDPALGDLDNVETRSPYGFANAAPSCMRDPSGRASLREQMVALVVRVRLQLTALGSAGAAFAERMRAHAASLAHAARNLGPDLGRKLDYLFGQATGNLHNITRSTDMYRQLRSIGLFDSPETRAYVAEHLRSVLYNPANISAISERSGFVIRQSLLSGPGGHVMLESIWDRARLVTVIIYGGHV